MADNNIETQYDQNQGESLNAIYFKLVVVGVFFLLGISDVSCVLSVFWGLRHSLEEIFKN